MKKLMMAAATVALMVPAAVFAFDGAGAHAHFDTMKMSKVLAMQSDEMKARYQYRHPKETLEFFGVTPGMVVADVLPGEEWYSSILLPYLGKNGLKSEQAGLRAGPRRRKSGAAKVTQKLVASELVICQWIWLAKLTL